MTSDNKVVLTLSGQLCRYPNPSGPTLGTKKNCCGLAQPARKRHVVALSPVPQLGWRGESEEKGKTRGLG